MESTRGELDRMLSESAESLLVCDPTGRIVGVNESLCALTGWERQDLLSKTIDDLVDTEAVPLGPLLREDAAIDLESEVRCKDGSTKRLQLRLRSVRIEDRPHSMVTVVRRRRAADRLPENPDFVRALLRSSGMLVVCVCPEGKLVFANPAFEDLIGIPFLELRGRKAWDLLPDPEERAVLRGIIESFQPSQTFECLWPAADGSRRRIAWTASRLASLPPGPPYLLFVGRDLRRRGDPSARLLARRSSASEPRRRRELEDRIATLTRDLEKARIEHDALTYALEHDFRAPLRAMSGLSDALVDECAQPSSEQGHLHFALRIAQSAQQMNSLIEHLLVFNRVARMPLQMEPQPLRTILTEVIQALSQEIRDRGASVTLDAPPLHVVADRTLLFLLLFQLVSNALKFVLPGVEPRVVLRVQPRKYFVRVTVEDNGIGIAEEFHDVIFDPCERLNSAEMYQGTGMGLAIAEKAVERLRARIGLESQAGKGSCFWVDLLAAPQDP